jgi:hypothetical protein
MMYLKPVKVCDIQAGSKVFSTTWMMEKKTSGRYKARITARGYEQCDSEHCDSLDAVNEITILICRHSVMAG